MPFSDYSELQSALASWIERPRSTSEIKDFIALFESRLRRILRARPLHAKATPTGTISSRELALPVDFVEPYKLFLTTYGVNTPLTPQHRAQIVREVPNGVPERWAIEGSNIILDAPCDVVHTFLFLYRASFKLTDSAPTNYLLTNHPDVYLYGGLAEEAIFAKDPAAASGYRQLLDAALEEVWRNEARSEAIAVLRVDPALSVAGSFNIVTGDGGGDSGFQWE